MPQGTSAGNRTPNIRDLPWIDEKDLTVFERGGIIVLPDPPIIVAQAKDVFVAAKKIERSWPERTEDVDEFLRQEPVRQYIRSLLSAYHMLKWSAAHTTVYCRFTDSYGNLCGAQMDITVDATGVYYRCPTNPSVHFQPVP